MEPNLDETAVLETPVEPVEETVETPAPTTEEIAVWKEKAAKADELEAKNKQLFERAKKAETDVHSKDFGSLTQKDILYLAKADIHEDDMTEVAEMAKLKNVSVGEAHKFMKPILDIRAEERRTADATHTKGGARGTATVSGEELLAQAQRGEDVELDDEKAKAIFQARLARKIHPRQRK